MLCTKKEILAQATKKNTWNRKIVYNRFLFQQTFYEWLVSLKIASFKYNEQLRKKGLPCLTPQ